MSLKDKPTTAAKALVDVDQVVAWVQAKVEALITQIKLIISRADFASIWTGITLIVSVVEEAGQQFDGLDGEKKKEVASKVLNNLIDIPFVPEWMEGQVFGMLIDWVVSGLNDLGWTVLEAAEKESEAKAAEASV